MNSDVVLAQETGTSVQPVNVNNIVDNVSNLVNNMCQLGKSFADLQNARVQAEKEITIIDRQIDQFVMDLNDKQKDREDRLKEIQALHVQMDNLISKATEIALRPDVNETQLQILQMIFNTINNCISKLPQL